MILERPLALVLLPLALLGAWWLARLARARRLALAAAWSAEAGRVAAARGRWRPALLALAALAAAAALPGPRWGRAVVTTRTSALNVVLAMDISRSMLAEDTRPSRLERALAEARRVVVESQGDRLGLVAFAGRSYILTPLTVDGSAIRLQLDAMTPDLASEGGSALGAALQQGTELLVASREGGEKVLVIFTDGEAHDSLPTIVAAALGYELQCRLCDAASLRKHGWDHVYYGALSTALLASRLCGLNVEQTVHALGLAGVCNFATRQTRTGQLSDWKACAFANAARNGIFAARLAREGLTGPHEIFEGPKGLFKMVTGPFELKWSSGPDDWMILRTYIKYWPAEYHSQSAIDAALQLRPECGDPRRIESIRIESFEAAVSIIGSEPEKWRPTSRETADHSMGYCVAVALLDGDVTRASFDEQRIRDATVLALLDRIRIVETAECNAGYPDGIPNRLIIRTGDGRELERLVKYPRGHAGNPMTDEEVIAKFRRQAEGVVSAATAQRLIELALALDTLPDVTPLLEFDVL